MSGSTLTSFTAGDLVISVVGDVQNTGTLSLDQASPIYLQELTTSGTLVGTMVLPQTTMVVNGVTEYGISGEYGSASEGSLQLSANGQSLVIVGYGVNANAFNTGTTYGTAALGQTTSIPGTADTAVPRVVADINATGTVDTSTALYNVFNTNNPRSVATANGTAFYLAGQGVKGDTTQGVFYAPDGATSATPIDTSTDTRFATIYNGQLLVSRDSTQNSATGTDIASYGSTLPTSGTPQTVLQGIDESVTLTAAQANTVNAGAVGTSVNLSPENFFFASPDVLYVADGGVPKNGGVGDGGLQKWVYKGTSWQLEYTLSRGLNLVDSTSATSGTSGLIGLTGTVVGGQVELFATTESVGELDQSYLYGITDTLTATSGTGESFSLLDTAAAGTIIRGISFAPQQATTSATSVTIGSGVTSSGLVLTSGSSLTVENGGTAISATLLSGSTETVSGGAVDSATNIAHGGSQTVLGTTFGDLVGGIQLVSAATAVVNDDVVLNGGSLELFLKGAVANAATVLAGGVLAINGNATANDTVLSGGTVMLESHKSVLSGGLTFAGAGTIEISTNLSATSGSVPYGDVAVMSGFGPGDAIDFTSATAIGAAGSAATLGTTTSGGDTIATVSGGGTIESFTFDGTVVGQFLSLTSDGNGGEQLTFAAPAPGTITVASGVTSSNLAAASGTVIDVLSGGTLVNATLLTGATAIVEIGGTDSASTVSSGSTEQVYGAATGDTVLGTQVLSAPSSAGSSVAVVSNEIVGNGGTVDLFLKGAIANAPTIDAGGTLAIKGNAAAVEAAINGGMLILESGKATTSGTLYFGNGGTLELTQAVAATTSTGPMAVIANFGSGDAVDYTFVGSGATLATTLSGGNTVATVMDGGIIQTMTFAGDVTSHLTLAADAMGGEEIVYTSSAVSSSGTSGIVVSSGVTSSGLVVSGGMSADVLSGGTIVGAQILSNASVTVEAGGIDSASTIAPGGSELLIGSATGDQVGGLQYIDGNAVSETILSGGSAVVETGGTDSGSVISAGGNETVLNSATGDQVYGIQLVSAATAVVSNEAVYNGGTVELFLAGVIGNGITVTSGGEVAINGRATLEAAVLSGGTVDLQSPKSTISGTLTWAGSATLMESDTIKPISSGVSFGDQAVNIGFDATDAIEFTSNTSVGAAGSAATLDVTTSGGDTFATVSGNGSTESFEFSGTALAGQLSLVTNGGLLELVSCFATGTRIETTRGAVAVENLVIGDMVPAKFAGAAVPIIWIGHRTVTCDRHPRPEQVWPVRVMRGAFGRNQPQSDLWLSPDHAVYVDKVLIPIKRLINGTSVAQVPVQQIAYYHIELPRHDVVTAEGLAVESYLDLAGRRSDFANGPGPMRLHPDFSSWAFTPSWVWEAFGCARLVVTGPEVEAAQNLVRRCTRRLLAA